MTLAIVAWPEAVMIRDFSTSAGEHTATGQLVHIMVRSALAVNGSRFEMGDVLVAIVPYSLVSSPCT